MNHEMNHKLRIAREITAVAKLAQNYGRHPRSPNSESSLEHQWRNGHRPDCGRTVLCIIVICALSCLATADDAEEDPARPSAIETVNVPVAPYQLFQELLSYQSVRQASFAGWAPDGRGVLIRTRFGNASQMHRVYRPGGRREQVTFFSEPPHGRFVTNSSSGDMILSLSRHGDERYQLYLYEPKEFRMTLLTDGRSRHTLGPFSPDGNRMIVRSNQRNDRDMDLYVADTKKRGSMKLLHRVTDEYWYASHWSNDSRQLLLRRHVSIVESYPALYDFDTGRLEMLPLATGHRASYSNLRFAPDGRHIYMTTDAFGEFRELALFDRETKRYKRLTSDIPWNVGSVAIDRQSGRFAFSVNQAGTSRLFLLDGDSPRRELKLPESRIVSDLRFSPDGTQLGLTLQSPTAPSDVFSLNLENGRLTGWTYSVVGGLNPDEFIEPSVIQFASFDDRPVSAFYYRPRFASAERPVPVIISIHGGPESQYRPRFSARTQYFIARMGCAVICPNVRGSTGYGKTFVELDNATKREDSVRDIGALLDWIAAQPELDSSRVAVTGRSYGGYMVLASLAHFGDRLCAGIEAAGIANFTSFLEQTESYRQDRRREEYGDERNEEVRAFFDRINPTSNAHKIRTPLLVVHGVHDPRVPFSEARQIVERLQALDRDVWAVYVNDEGHSFRKRNNTDYISVVEVMFLTKHLTPSLPQTSE